MTHSRWHDTTKFFVQVSLTVGAGVGLHGGEHEFCTVILYAYLAYPESEEYIFSNKLSCNSMSAYSC